MKHPEEAEGQDATNVRMSKLMIDLCRLLQVKNLKSFVYHPQTNGLVKRFNQSLKRMLKRVVDEGALHALCHLRDPPSIHGLHTL